MPAAIEIPRQYNAAQALLARHSQRADKVAFIDAVSGEQLTFGQLNEQAWRFANVLRAQGFEPESRVLLCMLDTPQWPVVFLGCMLAGVVPVATNTLLTTKDFDYMLRDSRARGLLVSNALLPAFKGRKGARPVVRGMALGCLALAFSPYFLSFAKASPLPEEDRIATLRPSAARRRAAAAPMPLPVTLVGSGRIGRRTRC